MLERLRALLGRIATWPVVALLFIGFVLCTFGFMARTERLGNNPPLLDGRYWYHPAEVQALFEKLGQEGRNLYALTEVTLDLAFPLIYGALLLIMIYRLFEPKPARILLLLPLVAMLSDLLENLSIVLMVWTYTGSAPGLAFFSPLFTLVKYVFVLAAGIVVLIGAVRALILKRTGEGEPSGSVVMR